MFPHTPDQVLGLGMATVVALAVANVGLRDREAEELTTLVGTRAAPVTQVADTLRAGDRRCLTRRPDDCLAEPVPADEPHGAVCAVCHDMWSSTTPAHTVRSCSGGECHVRPEAMTPFHRTVAAGVLAQCTACHLPHDFRVKGRGAECTVCHTSGGSPVTWAGAVTLPPLPAGLAFEHTDHTSVACATCHGGEERHGTVAVRDREGCRACHHTAPLAEDCTRCHVVDEVRATSFTVTRQLEIRIGSLDRPVRALPFDHAVHWHTDCTVCHTGGIDLETARGADCSGCHLQHHEPTATCTTCHEAPAPGAHDRTAHFGCGGAGCHDPVPAGIRSVPRTRELCLVCHRDRADHMVGRNCAGCHVLPPTS
jgi:hypothetical protein